MKELSTVEKMEPEQEIEELSPEKMEQLNKCETVIEKNLEGFWEVGTALAEIRDSHLYRKDYGTFEAYCKDKWDMSKAYAHRLIGSAQVYENLSPIGDIQPINEAQARPLAKLETPELQQEAWDMVVETAAPDGKVTAKLVKSVVKDFVNPKPDPEQKERGMKKFQEEQEKWDNEPVDNESQAFWTKVYEELDSLLTSPTPLEKIDNVLLRQVLELQTRFDEIICSLIGSSERPS